MYTRLFVEASHARLVNDTTDATCRRNDSELRNSVKTLTTVLTIIALCIVLVSAVWVGDATAQDSPAYIEPSSESFMVTNLSPEVSKSFSVLQALTLSGTSIQLVGLSLCQGTCATPEGELSSDNNFTPAGTDLDEVNGTWSFIDLCGTSADYCTAEVTFVAGSPGSSVIQLIALYEVSYSTGSEVITSNAYVPATLESSTEILAPTQTLSITSGIRSGPEGSQVPITVTRSADPCCSGLDALVLSLAIATSSTATEDEDFSFAAGSTMTWSVGETGEKTLLINILNDTENESVETIDVVIDENTLPAQALVDNRQVSIDIPSSTGPEDLITEIVSGTDQAFVPGGDTGEDMVVQVTGNAVGQPGTAIRVVWTVVPAGAATLRTTDTFVDANGSTSNGIVEILVRGFIQVFATATVEAVVQSPPQGNTDSGRTLNSSPFQAESLSLTPRINPPPAPELASNVARFILRSGFFPGTGLTDNQANTGQALDNACTELDRLSNSDATLTTAQDDLLDTCAQLDSSVTGGGLASAINRLMPEEAFAMADSSVEASDIQVTNVVSRINALRSGGVRSLDLGGLSLDYYDQHIPGAVFNAVQNVLSATSSADTLVSDTPRLGVFASGRLSVGEIDGAGNQKSADFTTQGVTLGADYRISPTVVLGGSVGFTSVDTDFQSDQDTLAVEGVFVTLFGTWYNRDAAYVDAVLQAGNNTYDSVRRINLPGAAAMFANGSTDAQINSFTIGAGRQYKRDNWEVGPYLRATVTSADVDGYTESAASSGQGFGSVLSIGSHSISSTTVSAGVQVSAAVSTTRVVLVPQFWIEGEFETETSKDDISATFVHDPTASVFTIRGNERDSSYANYGLGTSIFWPGLRSVFVFFESQLGHDFTTQYWLKLGTRLNF